MSVPIVKAEAEPPPLLGTVLYIEDSDVNYNVVEAQLARHPGLTLIRAPTGRSGVERARRDNPDLLLLDMHLPDISGTDVVRMLSKEISERRFRVILLTADSLTIDVLKAMSLGAFEYLVKPVQSAALEGAIRRALATSKKPDRR